MRARLPRKVPPKSVALSYYRAFVPILEAARAALMRAVEPLLPALEAEARAVRGDTRVWSNGTTGAFEAPHAGSTPATRTDASRLNDILDAVGKEFFERLKPAEIEAVAERFARATSEWEKEQAAKQVRAAFGVDVLTQEPRLAGRTSAFISENVALIKSIPSQFFDDVEKRVARAVSSGATAKELAAEISKAHGVADDRAMLIARDQIGKFHAAVAEARQSAMGVTHYIWRTSNDERVREEHAAREGETFAWDDPPDGGHPGEDFQCFPGDTLLTPSSGIQKLYRRWITDNLTEIVAANGVTLRATRNHPVLTAAGWKRAESVDVGDYLLDATDQVRKLLVMDLQGAQSVFVETFRAAERVFGARHAHVLGSGFHGDVTDEDVDVVDVDWSLAIGDLDPALDERVCYDILAFADESGARLGELAPMFDALLLATHRGVRGGCKLLSLVLAEECMAGEHPLAAIAWRDAAADQLVADGRATDAEAVRKLFDGMPFGVEGYRFVARVIASVVGRAMMQPASLLTPLAELDAEGIRVDEEQARGLGESGAGGHQLLRVVEKRVGELAWSGHVYNLQSPSQQYIAQGMIVHNCRCFAEPVLAPLLEGTEPHARAQEEPAVEVRGEVERPAPPVPRNFVAPEGAPPIGRGVPSFEEARGAERAPLNVVRPSDLLGRIFALPNTRPGGVENILDVWERGKKLGPIKVVIDERGNMSVSDGRHRLIAALVEGKDRKLLVEFEHAPKGVDFSKDKNEVPVTKDLAKSRSR